MLKRIFLFMIFLGVLGVGGGLIYVFFFPTESSYALNAVPEDASFIIHIEKPHKTWRKIMRSDFWKTLQKNEFVYEQTENIRYIDSLIASNEYLLKIFKDRPVTISIHKISPKDWDFLAIVELQKEIKILALKQFMRTLLETFDYKFTSRKFKKEEIWEIQDKETREILHIVFYNNLLLLSYSAKLVENALASLEAPYFIKEPDFMKLLTSDELKGDLQTFVPMKNFQEFLKIYTDSSYDLSAFSYLGTAVNIQNDEVFAQGKLLLREDTLTYFHVLAEHKPTRISAHKILPQTVGLFTAVTLENFKETQTKLMELWKKQSPEEYEDFLKSKEQLENFLKIDLEEDFFSWLGDEAVIIQDKFSRKVNKIVALKLADKEKALERMEYVMKRIKKKTPFKNIEEEYKDFKIYKLKVKGFFNLVFGRFFKDLPMPVFTFYKDYLFFASNELELKLFLDNLETEKLLLSKVWKKHSEKISLKSSLFVYYDAENFYPALKNIFSEETMTDIERNKDLFLSFRSAAMNLSSEEEDYKFRFNLYIDNGRK